VSTISGEDQVTITTEGDKHWVGANGMTMLNDEWYFIVSPTSKYDKAEDTKSTGRKSLGWTNDGDGNLLVPDDLVSGYVTYSRPAGYQIGNCSGQAH
jgi:hypothetical protein